MFDFINVIYYNFNSHQTCDFYTIKTIFIIFNKNVVDINRYMFYKFFETKIVCNNRNEIVNEENSALLFIQIINVFESISLLSHYLKLKKNCSIMLLRNLKQNMNLCNETRLQIKHIDVMTFNIHILDNKYNGKRYFISRILFASLNSNELYILFRRY